MNRLILFDVDGTLLSCGDQVRELFAAALRHVFATAGEVDGYDFSGKTDGQIVLELMTAAGFERGTILRRMGEVRRAYVARLETGLRAGSMRLLPGVGELLHGLTSRSQVVVGLLTGNWRRGAYIKLSRVGLERFFTFGAFGDDGLERRQLPPVALRRAAETTRVSFRPQDVLVVGDSVNDIACAKTHGLACLAVATGRTALATLQAAGADWVVPDLASPEVAQAARFFSTV